MGGLLSRPLLLAYQYKGITTYDGRKAWMMFSPYALPSSVPLKPLMILPRLKQMHQKNS